MKQLSKLKSFFEERYFKVFNALLLKFLYCTLKVIKLFDIR